MIDIELTLEVEDNTNELEMEADVITTGGEITTDIGLVVVNGILCVKVKEA